MFKHLIIYRLGAERAIDAAEIEDKLAARTFAPTGPTQQKSTGWIPPRGEGHGALVEVVDGHVLLKLQTEVRSVPSKTVQELVDKMADTIEEQTGRKPGRKHRKELKEQALLELMPSAFPKRRATMVWINGDTLAVEAGSISQADDIVTELVQALELPLRLVQSHEAPAGVMASWLLDGEAANGLTIDRDLMLHATDETKARVRYSNHSLDSDEVRQHVKSGMVPASLALTWRERVSFVLTDALVIKGLKFLDLVFEGKDRSGSVDAFDADAAIATGELSRMLPDLIESLGGEIRLSVD